MVEAIMIDKITNIPIYDHLGRVLYVIDIDNTLFNRQGLIDPNTRPFLDEILVDHDIVICTFRTIDYRTNTIELFQLFGLDNVLNQHIGQKAVAFEKGLLSGNIIYTVNKGTCVKEFTELHKGRWDHIVFVDDNEVALMQMFDALPEVELYLMSS